MLQAFNKQAHCSNYIAVLKLREAVAADLHQSHIFRVAISASGSDHLMKTVPLSASRLFVSARDFMNNFFYLKMEHVISMQSAMPTKEIVLNILHNVIDPEVGMNIVDLGLVYGVEISGNKLRVDLTMTTPACPMGDMILNDARRALAGLVPANAEIEINLVWEPPWSPDKMNEQARDYFGWE